MRVRTVFMILSMAALAAAGGALRSDRASAQRAAVGRVDFADDVLPILATHCFRCHGGVREKAGLNLADPERVRSVLASGHAAVVPGDPARSELLARITTSDPDERMPSDGSPLLPQEIDTIRRWIGQGAPWGTHWSFAERVEPPAPGKAGDGWTRRELDRFVAARQATARLKPAPETDRASLLRRVALDAKSFLVQPAEVDHGALVALLGRLLEPLESHAEVGFDA